MNRSVKRQFSIASVMILTGVVALLMAIPRATSGVQLHPTAILWIVTLHQIVVAVICALILWVLLARRAIVGALLILLILCLWGPNLAATIEYSATGKNTKSLAVANSLGLTSILNAFYSATSDLMGYRYVSTGR